MNDTADVFTGLMPFLRVKPELQLICRFGAQWTVDHDPEEAAWAPFHIITRGTCVLQVGEVRHILRAGDVVVLPHGGPHILQAQTGGTGQAMRIERRLDSGVFIRTNLAEGDETEKSDTQLICGRMRFEEVRNNMVLATLPPVVVIAAGQGDDAGRARGLVDTVTGELQADRLGAGAIAVELSSALMMIVLRAYFESSPTAPGILALLSHPQTGRAVTAMFADLLRPWTLDDLAAEARTSRATLVRMFRRAAGTAPLTFLAELRLDLARRRVQSEMTPLAVIAQDAGYQSQSAFHRAFQRRYGAAPGAFRRDSEAATGRLFGRRAKGRPAAGKEPGPDGGEQGDD